MLVDGLDDPTTTAALIGRTHREAPEIDGVVRLDADVGAARARSCARTSPRPIGPDLVAKAAVRRRRERVSAPRGPRVRRVRRRGAIATPANFVTIAPAAARGADAAAHRRRGLHAGSPFASGSCSPRTDGLDGWLARRDGTTRSGAFLDPLADKFLVLGGFFALGINGATSRGPRSVIVAVREVGISMYRSFAARRGISLPAPQLGQVEGVLPVPRGRRRALPADVRVGDVPRHRAVDRGRVRRWSRASTSCVSGWQQQAKREGRISMRCDVLAIGTELLLGQIVDTNSSWIGEQLAAVGHRHLRAPQGRRQPRPHGRSACASCSTAPTRSSCAAASGPRPTTSPARRSPR